MTLQEVRDALCRDIQSEQLTPGKLAEIAYVLGYEVNIQISPTKRDAPKDTE